MDGINGITAAYSLSVLILLAIVNYYKEFINPDLIYYSILGVLVFGFFNFREKAKCFAGDVGSVSIAFIVVFLIIKLIVMTENFIYILFLSVYGLDAIWTIIRRIFKKENIFQAHRSHLYQYLANENKSNKLFVSSAYGIVQLVIGFLVIFGASLTIPEQLVLVSLILGIGSFFYLALKQRLIKKHSL